MTKDYRYRCRHLYDVFQSRQNVHPWVQTLLARGFCPTVQYTSVLCTLSIIYLRHSVLLETHPTMTELYPDCIQVDTWGRILDRNWDKSLTSFPPCCHLCERILQPPPPHAPPHPWAKLIWNWFVMQTLCMETSSLRTPNTVYVHEFGFLLKRMTFLTDEQFPPQQYLMMTNKQWLMLFFNIPKRQREINRKTIF